MGVQMSKDDVSFGFSDFELGESLKTLGINIRRFRKAKGLTIQDLAEVVDSDVGNISRLERGQQGYSHEIVFRISRVLNVELSDLHRSGTTQKESEIQKTALRIPKNLHVEFHLAAKKSGRTMNAEIVHRLRGSFSDVDSERAAMSSQGSESEQYIIGELERLIESLRSR